MLTNIIYFIVFIILAFVLAIAVKAITRGVEAKQILKEENNMQYNNDKDKNDLEILNQIKELKDLNDKGVLSDDEFKKQKKKY